MIPFAEHPWNEIVPNLFMGGHDYRVLGGEIEDVIVRDEFDLVVSLHKRWGHGPTDSATEIVRRIPDGELDADQLDQVAVLGRKVASQVEHKRKVLVRCQAGYNRSGLVVGFALMAMGKTADEAIALIRERRSRYALCNSYFVDYLQATDLTSDAPAPASGAASESAALAK